MAGERTPSVVRQACLAMSEPLVTIGIPDAEPRVGPRTSASVGARPGRRRAIRPPVCFGQRFDRRSAPTCALRSSEATPGSDTSVNRGISAPRRTSGLSSTRQRPRSSCGSPTMMDLDPGYVARCSSVLQANPDHVVVCGRGMYYRGGTYAFTERAVNLVSSHHAGHGCSASSERSRSTGRITASCAGMRSPNPPPGAGWAVTGSSSPHSRTRERDGPSTASRSTVRPEGASQHVNSLPRVYGLTQRQARHWYAIVAGQAFWEIHYLQMRIERSTVDADSRWNSLPRRSS